ncbi:putative NRPS-like protein biosynthetic cluster [Gnomoniopsis sp. IMI 355080]|nr:putative NRPS-like protein biosynthetic cluster [Gnomoniopsis sp. IMI 355080]
MSSKRVRFHISGWTALNKTADADTDNMSKTNLNYFTCTLGEAAKWNEAHPHPFETVNDLIDVQAGEMRQRPAVNFPGGCNGEDGRAMKSEFILTWLGLMRLGVSVMLLAPQLEPKAIEHLCHTCKITTVFADARNYDTAKNLSTGVLAINISNVLYNLKVDPAATILIPSKASDIAYLFHTSGTSSGLPKPIPQTHYAAVGTLPRLPGGEGYATFSTTPLYHGGIADCFRAWTSGATIHLFPGTQPITTDNIRRAVDRANSYLRGSCPARYFTSVPYILQMLLAESSSSKLASGLNLLQVMDLVGVGGAALPPSIGDDLVANDVKLVSRFGSAECGFLLSSHREYATDHEWAYLRANPALQPGYYDFERQAHEDRDEGGDGPPLFEFVVKPEWPHRGKTNRPDGSFATADLFEAHPTIPHAWRYHSRADAQIILINGKKFDPAPMESDLLTSAVGKQTLRDAMIFGTGRESPGILLLPRCNDASVDNEQAIREVWPTIERMNRASQSHARIGRESIVVAHGTSDEPAALPKSSKGTILRGQAEELFAADIEGMYADTGDPSYEGADIPDSKVMEELTNLFDNVLGREVSPTADLFAQGVDSVACAKLRKRIAHRFSIATEHPLPLNIIYDQGSIDQLARYILRCRITGDVAVPGGAGNEEAQSEEQLMLDLVENHRYESHFPTTSFDHQRERVVLLTGATGFLGAHVLVLLLRDAAVSKIFCLVRAQDTNEARERVLKSLQSRELEDPERHEEHYSKLVCLPSTLSDSHLGLADAEWDQISAQCTMIIHAAWPVNFSLKLQSFVPQLIGLRNLLELRDATRGSAARFVLISSTAAVSALSSASDRPILETLSSDPEDAAPLGYGRSKWVAEHICASARVGSNSSVPATSGDSTPSAEEKTPIMIIRVGQLCGSQQRGVWNATEAWPLLLSAAARITGSLPGLENEPLSWLPVDVAARGVLELAFLVEEKWTASRGSKVQKTPVYHVVNSHRDPSWGDMVAWLVGEEENQQELRVVTPETWLRQLEDALESGEEHPAGALVHMWKKSFSSTEHDDRDGGMTFDTRRAEEASDVMRGVRPLDQEGMVKMWRWIVKNV